MRWRQLRGWPDPAEVSRPWTQGNRTSGDGRPRTIPNQAPQSWFPSPGLLYLPCPFGGLAPCGDVLLGASSVAGPWPSHS